MVNEQNKPRRDFRQDLTDQIVQLVEQGVAPWQKPWNANAASLALEMPRNATTGRAYRGGNAVWLMLKAQAMGSADPRWCTFKQAQDAGWKIRKGSKGTSVEYWQFDRDDARQNPVTGKAEKVRVKLDNPRVFYATVFHASQIDGVPEHAPRDRAQDWDPVAEAERILAGSGARIHHDQQDGAYYAPRADDIHLPPREAFVQPLDYYEVALHELGHWTGHPSRLNRDLSGTLGSESYAREELRAQMASLFLAAEVGVPFNPERHAAYQASWVKSLRNDKHEIFRAARDAEQMAGYVMGLSIDRIVEASPDTSTLSDAPAFQQREPQQDRAASLSVPQVKVLIAAFCQQYPVAYDVSYRVRDTLEELYGTDFQQPDAHTIKAAFRPGYFDAAGHFHRGRCDIPAAHVRDERDLARSLRHEVLGHFGINTLEPAHKAALLASIIQAREQAGIAQLWAQVDRIYGDKAESVRAEEVYALFCEALDPLPDVDPDSTLQSFRETCIDRSRPMRLTDLALITSYVAVGLHERTRTQQVFPQPGQQFRLSDDISPDKDLSMSDKDLPEGRPLPAVNTPTVVDSHLASSATPGAADPRVEQIRARRNGAGPELIDLLRSNGADKGMDQGYAAWVGMDVSDLTALPNPELRAQAIEEMARVAARDIDYRLSLENWPDIAREVRLARKQLSPETPATEVAPAGDSDVLQDQSSAPAKTPAPPTDAEQARPDLPVIGPYEGDPGYDPSFGGFDNGFEYEGVDHAPEAFESVSAQAPAAPASPFAADDGAQGQTTDRGMPAPAAPPESARGLTQAPEIRPVDARHLAAESANRDPAANAQAHALDRRPPPRHPLRKGTQIEVDTERLQKMRKADMTAAQGVLDGSKQLQQQASAYAAARRQAEPAPEAFAPAATEPASEPSTVEDNELVGNASPAIDAPEKPIFEKTGYALPAAIAARYVVRDGSFWDAKAQLDPTAVAADGKPQPLPKLKPLFVDHGPRLATHKDDRATVSDMVAIAQAKGWTSLTVRGSETYRRNAWIEASLAGLEVQGFRPAEHDQVALEAARREREALRITPGRPSQQPAATVNVPASPISASEAARGAALAARGAKLRAVPDQTVSVNAMRQVFESTIAGQPENVRREATMRFDARVKAIVEVQAMGLNPAVQKTTLEKRFAELDAAWNRPADSPETTTAPTPERGRAPSASIGT